MKTRDFIGNAWEFDCMGCAVSDGSMAVLGGFIQCTPHFCVHQDPLISLPGFLVIASSRHIFSFCEMQPVEYDEFCGLQQAATCAIREATNVEHLTLIQEESSQHFHLWFFPWSSQVIERYGQPSLEKIRRIMADYREKPVSSAEWRELEESIEVIRRCWRGK